MKNKKKKKEKETKNENHPLNFQGHNRALNQWHLSCIPFIQTPTVWLPCPKVSFSGCQVSPGRNPSRAGPACEHTSPAHQLCSSAATCCQLQVRLGELEKKGSHGKGVSLCPPHHPWPEFMDVKSTLCRDKPPLEQPQPRGLQAAPSASSHSPHIPPWGSVGLHRGRRAAIPPPGLSRL